MERGFNANQLKLIAIIAMTVDHLAWTLWPGYDLRWYVLLCHIIGRLTAPIMWFFIAEGYHHTRSVGRYALRLFTLAMVSHFAYNFCFGIPMLPLKSSVFNQTGVLWSLAWGLVLVWYLDKKAPAVWKQVLAIVFACLITFPADWSCIAALAVCFLAANRGNFRRQMLSMMLLCALYGAVYFVFLDPWYGLMQLFTCLSIPLLRRYNGQRGSCRWLGRFFYVYYPAHLAAFGLLRVLL